MSENDPLLDALERTFGFRSFQPGQREVIEAVLSGRPTVLIMPTGAGKSLCYQLPSVLLDGLTIVVSPLIALMKDQVDALRARGVAADVLNSSQTAAEQRSTMQRARRGELRLLYVAPERFGNDWFAAQLDGVDVALFAVDEAHCISRWGHDFRPDYRRLRDAVERLRPGRVLACTATATPEVRDDIVDSLGLDDPATFISGFLRTNLFLDVRFCAGDRDKEEKLLRLLTTGAGAEGSAIVYASTRKRVEALSGLLSRSVRGGLVGYHAGMSHEERSDAQERFIRGEARVAVATNAFGMGIDRADVRVVAHAEMPRTVEGYYQEVGRAGRDGEPSCCVMLYNANDRRVHEYLIDKGDSEEHKALERSKLVAMQRMVHSTECRHRFLLNYFGEPMSADCPGCSRCGAAPRLEPAAATPATAVQIETLRIALSGVARANARFGLKKVAGMLAGSRAREIIATPLGSLSTYGRLSALGVDGCERLLHSLVDEGLCTFVGQDYPLLMIDRAGIEVMAGRVAAEPSERTLALLDGRGSSRAGGLSSVGGARGPRARGPVAVVAAARRNAPSASGDEVDADPELVQVLRAWRREEAGTMPAFVIMGDRTLRALAAARPRDEAEFLAVPGLGKAKWAKFGEAVIALIEAHQR